VSGRFYRNRRERADFTQVRCASADKRRPFVIVGEVAAFLADELVDN
jgi:hypothetical protein